MSRPEKAAVQIVFLLMAVWAGAVAKNASLRVKVLDSETHSAAIGDQTPKNCDGVNYDAYCNSSKTSIVTNTLLVQEGDRPPYRISCNIDTKWSHCVPLEKGVTVEARREKRGLLVYYVDEVGRVRKQLYTFVESQGGTVESVAAPTSVKPQAEHGPVAIAAIQNPPPVPVLVKCSFTSTPAGAEVNVDGRYVGSTPSVVNLSVGSHAVGVSLPGFAQWKRDLAVTAGAELTVNAVLEKVR